MTHGAGSLILCSFSFEDELLKPEQRGPILLWPIAFDGKDRFRRGCHEPSAAAFPSALLPPAEPPLEGPHKGASEERLALLERCAVLKFKRESHPRA
jgi:hypothetical protein